MAAHQEDGMAERNPLAVIGAIVSPWALAPIGWEPYADHVRRLHEAEKEASERAARLDALGTMAVDEGWTDAQLERWLARGELPPPPGRPLWASAPPELLADIGRACWEATRPTLAGSR